MPQVRLRLANLGISNIASLSQVSVQQQDANLGHQRTIYRICDTIIEITLEVTALTTNWKAHCSWA